MLTKGLVKSKTPDGYYVRIPYLETATSGPVVLRCSLSHEPALGEAIAVGDVVILGFEDHNADKPVVLGKLALPGEGHRGYADLVDLSVSGKAALPMDTTIGGVSAEALIGGLRLGSVNGEAIDSLQGALASGGPSEGGVVVSVSSIRVPTGRLLADNSAAADSHEGSDPAFSGGVSVGVKVVSGSLKARDEICVCARHSSKSARQYTSSDGTGKTRYRVRYRWKVCALYEVTEADASQGRAEYNILVPYDSSPKHLRFYKGDFNGGGASLRCVRVRRPLTEPDTPIDAREYVPVSNEAGFMVKFDDSASKVSLS